jgi:hypothetical protein
MSTFSDTTNKSETTTHMNETKTNINEQFDAQQNVRISTENSTSDNKLNQVDVTVAANEQSTLQASPPPPPPEETSPPPPEETSPPPPEETSLPPPEETSLPLPIVTDSLLDNSSPLIEQSSTTDHKPTYPKYRFFRHDPLPTNLRNDSRTIFQNIIEVDLYQFRDTCHMKWFHEYKYTERKDQVVNSTLNMEDAPNIYPTTESYDDTHKFRPTMYTKITLGKITTVFVRFLIVNQAQDDMVSTEYLPSNKLYQPNPWYFITLLSMNYYDINGNIFDMIPSKVSECSPEEMTEKLKNVVASRSNAQK